MTPGSNPGTPTRFMSFIKNTETFVCEHCGQEVRGEGYTNHCPACLWSKHVDNDPGDRANPCQGLMEPIGVDYKDGEHVLIHKCQRCGELKRNKVSKKDDFDRVIKLAKDIANK